MIPIVYYFGTCSIKGELEYIYSGDRTREDLLQFAYRMSGPPVQQITQIDSLEMLKSQNDLFFTYVGQRNGSLWEGYLAVAEHFQPHAYFYATTRHLASQHFDVDTAPVVLVYKESHYYHFPCKYRLGQQKMSTVYLNSLLTTQYCCCFQYQMTIK